MTSAAALLRDTDLPHHEGHRLLMAATGRSLTDLMSAAEIDAEATSLFRELARRRRAGEPLQYLEGEVDFGPLTLVCDRRALVPRPETEGLATMAAAAARPGDAVVDLGTGSGCIALFVKHQVPTARVIATDIDHTALSLAVENGARTGLEVEWRQGDLFEALPPATRGSVWIVVTNPPYVASGDWRALPEDVRRYEPEHALVAGPRGTEIMERIAAEAMDWLAPGGTLLVEIGETQGDTLRGMFSAYGPEIHADLTGRDRYLVGRRA